MKILCVFGENSYGDPARGKTHEYANFIPAFRRAGHDVRLFDSFVRRQGEDFATLNLGLLREALDFRPEIIFLVLMNYEIWTETLDLFRAHTPALTINWGTDDSWKFDQVSRVLAQHLDFHVTTHKNAFLRARALNLNNILRSQWGASDDRLATPLPSAECEHDVSFVGQLYGNRRRWIDGLRERGIRVVNFGHGSKRGAISTEELLSIYRKSRISLNFADAGERFIGLGLRQRRQIKARVFEVTGAGGLLLTQEADDLSDYFCIGHEIDTFNDLDELAHKVRIYLADPEARDGLAQAGHQRTAKDHTYVRRFSDLLSDAFRRLTNRRQSVAWTLEPQMLAPHIASHRDKAIIGPLRTILERPAQAVFGRKRGSRAARRFLFLSSRRLLGARTFSAAGLPGRLFYDES